MLFFIPFYICTAGIRVGGFFAARAFGDGRADCVRRRGEFAGVPGVVLHIQVQPE